MNIPGFLLIDKPANITSHDVIDRLRRITKLKCIGHAGTLDPFATGLLLVGVERDATKEMQKMVGLDKKYEATFVLGATSDTDDVKGKLSELVSTEHLTEEQIRTELQSFTGEIDQVPPTYAAIKVGGKKLYELAREGKPMLVEPRKVTIYSIKQLPTPSLHNSITPSLSLAIHCSSGTYIRSIARDLGEKLGVGGYVETLRRTSIGPFSIDECTELKKLTAENWQESLIPVDKFLARL